MATCEDIIREAFLKKFEGLKIRVKHNGVMLTTEPITDIKMEYTYDGLLVCFMVGKKNCHGIYYWEDLPETVQPEERIY